MRTVHSACVATWMFVVIFTASCPSVAQTRWQRVDSPGLPQQTQHTGFLTSLDGSFLTTIRGYDDQGVLFHAYGSADGSNWQLTAPTKGVFIDVTDRVQYFIDRGYSRIGVDDGLAMMSIPGRQTLELTYRWSQGRFRVAAQEGQYLNIPDPRNRDHELLDRSDTSPTTEIISADYGSVALSPFDPISAIGTFMGKRVLVGQEHPYEDVTIAYPENDTWVVRDLPGYDWDAEEGPRHIATGPDRCLVATEHGLAFSSDLENWTEVDLPFSGVAIRDLEFAAGIFVAVGSMGNPDYSWDDGPGIAMTSIDGISWTFALFPDGTVLNAVAHGGGQWACGGDDGVVYTSADGYLWSQAPALQGDVDSLVFGNDTWVIGTGSRHVLSSPDLQSWSLQSETAGPTVVAGPNHFMALNPSGQLHVSPFLPAGTADITDHPEDVLILLGQTAAFTVTAGGDGPLSYQWFEGSTGNTSTPVAGATGPSFESPPLAESTEFWVRVSNSLGEDFSNTAHATVAVIPEITAQPAGFSTDMGDYASMKVHASGGGLQYQWHEGLTGDSSRPVAGATSSSYAPPRDTPGTTNYWVRVTNIAGFVDSHAATATVLPVPPVITGWETEVTTPVWSHEWLIIDASGPYLSYQYYRGESGDTSQPVQGATSRYHTPDYNTVGESRFWVRVSNAAGHVDSATAVYTVTPRPPRITSTSSDQVVIMGYDAYLSVSATPYQERSYQWFKGESGDTTTPMADETSSGFSSNSLGAGLHKFWVRVSNPHGSTDSRTMAVRVVVDSYPDWAAAHGLPTDGSGTGHVLSSAAGDGVPNLIRYARGLGAYEPTTRTPDQTTYTDPMSGESYLAMWITASKIPGDISPGLQESTNGETWNATGIDTGIAVDHGDETLTRLFRSSVPFSAGHRHFIRAAISHTP